MVLHGFHELLVLAGTIPHLHAAGVPDCWVGDVSLSANFVAASNDAKVFLGAQHRRPIILTSFNDDFTISEYTLLLSHHR